MLLGLEAMIRSGLYYLTAFMVILGLLWFIGAAAASSINLKDTTSGWYFLGPLLRGGPGQVLIVLTSAFLAGIITIAILLGEISDKLTTRNKDT